MNPTRSAQVSEGWVLAVDSTSIVDRGLQSANKFLKAESGSSLINASLWVLSYMKKTGHLDDFEGSQAGQLWLYMDRIGNLNC